MSEIEMDGACEEIDSLIDKLQLVLLNYIDDCKTKNNNQIARCTSVLITALASMLGRALISSAVDKKTIEKFMNAFKKDVLKEMHSRFPESMH